MLNTLRPAPVLSPSGRCGFFRQIAESFVLLAIAVVIFRAFAVEGYLISTGSMAPTLLGYHRQVVCPECDFSFAHSAPAEEDTGTVERAWADYEIGLPAVSSAQCPNCGFQGIPIEQLPRTEGDQLLVHKQAFEFRNPRRWEVIVFRNPGDPRQAYVKRVVGLPGETVAISNGNVVIDGKLARKPYAVQKATALLVSKYASQIPQGDPDCRSSWVLLEKESPWQAGPGSLHCKRRDGDDKNHVAWVGHRHWIRSGGTHLTRVPLAKWPQDLEVPKESYERLRYSDGQLQTVGVLTDFERRAWLLRSDDPAFHRAIEGLFQQSHIAPIMDHSAYNAADPEHRNPLDEFLISLTLQEVQGEGRFEIEMSDGRQIFTAVFDFSDHCIELLRNGDPVPLRQSDCSQAGFAETMQIDFSLIDDQAILAVNGEEVFPPYVYDGAGNVSEMRRSVRFGAAGIACEVGELSLSRDIYYTSKDPEKKNSWQLNNHEFFVLGDNSSVSVDSRVWKEPGVPRKALIGKPLVVHLPSRTRMLRWGGENHPVRVPDFSRVRLVR